MLYFRRKIPIARRWWCQQVYKRMSPNGVLVEHDTEQQYTLPDDVLIHIFILISQDHGPVVFPIQSHDKIPQLALSHVCSRWRALALSTFELWSNVHLVNPNDNCVSLLLNEWLPRVRGSPMSLRFTSQKGVATAEKVSAAARVIQNIVSYFRHQIKILHIDLTFRQFKALSSFPNSILPHIETLELEFDSSDVKETFSSIPVSFPRLRSVVVSDRRSWALGALLNTPLPWSLLQCLKLKFTIMYLVPVFNSLRQMPLLQDLHFCMQSDIFSRHLAALKKLTIPNLRRIRFKLFTHPDDAREIFRSITCGPALIELDISRSIGSKEIIEQQYNLQGLEELSFFDSTIPASSILQEAPKLRRLQIKGGTFDDEAIVGLSNGTLGRCLRELTINSAGDTGRLLSMVEMRKRTVDKLIENGCDWSKMITAFREVSIYGKDHSGGEYAERIDALKRVGIKVSLPFL